MYTVSFHSFRITDTRSLHRDTDYASLSPGVGSAHGCDGNSNYYVPRSIR